MGSLKISVNKSIIKKWIFTKNRLSLIKWSAGYFTVGALLFILIGLRYLTSYSLPNDILGLSYTLAAFTSHFFSFALIFWLVLIFPLTLLFPIKKFIIPLSVLVISIIMTLELLDSQIFTAHRFHFTMLTIRILGWKTWGFGIFYLLILLVFNSFLSKMMWHRIIVTKKRSFCITSAIAGIVLLAYTHCTHVWADATGYLPITRFSTTMPLFYPTTAKKFMIKHGFVNISNRRELPKDLGASGANFHYPIKPLQFEQSMQSMNILIIGVDDMRRDLITTENTPVCIKYANQSGIVFTNHWSGGNSTKMGLFSLFYGIPPTYQQYVENNKRSTVFMDRILEQQYSVGIFTSYRLYSPADLDITAFVKVPNLRLETKTPGPSAPFRNDSAITQEWRGWLDKKASEKPFFGFLFYDALCAQSFPPEYESRVKVTKGEDKYQKEFSRYCVSMQYIDSLIGDVFKDLEKRDLMKNTIIIITADHGEEFDDNKLGFKGHGSAFSDYQIGVPLIVFWPNKQKAIINKRTSHYDIIATLMKDALLCKNDISDFSSGNNLFTDKQWDWLIVGSYFNFAIREPQSVTIQYPGGYYEVRDLKYQIVPKPPVSSNLASALSEMGRFYKR